MILNLNKNNFLFEIKNDITSGFSYLKFIFYSTLIAICLLDFLSGYLHILPRQFTWLTEIFSLMLCVVIFADIAFYKFSLKINFLIYFLFIWFLITFFGIISNNVSPFVVFAGLRNYFKFIPFFIALSIYPLSERFFKNFINIIILVSAMQLIFVIPEKIIYWKKSGDLIVGSLGSNASGTLVIFQLLSFSIIISFYKADYYTFKQFLFYSILILLSTFITEGKIVFFILPILFFVNFINIKNFRKNFVIIIIGILAMLLGVLLYNSLYGNIERHFINYNETFKTLGVSEISYGKNDRLRRISQVHFMIKNINNSFYSKFFGYGIGNASDSFFYLSKGEYNKRYYLFGIDKIFISRLGWEFGYSGVILFLCFLFILYKYNTPSSNNKLFNGILDARKGIIIVILFSSFYNNALIMNSTSFIFWSFLGIFNNILLHK